ncbi:MAG TPA: flagellar biosynthetic protein FliR [Candidatus Eisenbacteria bacterium]|nr:flagellar biosynthetic protein FliR [Candidatus Eisenbacteria bacterium]
MAIPDPVPFLLVVARLSGLVLAAPIFGHLLVPMRVRAGFVGVLALALAPAVGGPGVEASVPWGLAGLVAMEAAIGVLIGFVAQLVFAGVQLGGQVAGLQVGFGIASLIDPGSQASTTVVAQWQQLAALLVFLVLDVHHVVLRALIESFRVAPVGHVVVSGALLEGMIAQAASLFAVGVRIAAPVLVTLLLVNGTLGVLARTIPQLNVFAVGFPVNVGVGLLVLGASLPLTVRFLAGRFDDLAGVLATLVQGLGALAHG